MVLKRDREKGILQIDQFIYYIVFLLPRLYALQKKKLMDIFSSLRYFCYYFPRLYYCTLSRAVTILSLARKIYASLILRFHQDDYIVES